MPRMRLPALLRRKPLIGLFGLVIAGCALFVAGPAQASPSPTPPAGEEVHQFGYSDLRAVTVDSSTGVATLSSSAPAATGWNGSAVSGGYETSSGLTWILTDSSPCELHAQNASGTWVSSVTLSLNGCLALLVNNDASSGSGTAYVSTYAPPHNLLNKVDLSTGAALSNVDTGSNDIRGMTKSPTTGKVWAAVVGPGSSNGLFELNLSSGAISNRIDITTFGYDFWGVAADSSGRLWFDTYIWGSGSYPDEDHLSSILPEDAAPLSTFTQGPRIRMTSGAADLFAYAIWIAPPATAPASTPALASTGSSRAAGLTLSAATLVAGGIALAMWARRIRRRAQ